MLPVPSNHWATHLFVQLFPEAVTKASVSRVRAVRLRLKEIKQIQVPGLLPSPRLQAVSTDPRRASEHLSVRIDRLGPGQCPILMRSV